MTGLESEKQVVSFDSESLILVDRDDREIGQLSKRECHTGAGTLHRAFSLFVFNSDRELLLQQRASGKLLWPGFWSNSVCSHPRAGESMPLAVDRRLEQELGLRADLTFVYKFVYQASFATAGSEHEFCSVYVGVSDLPIKANPTEVAAWRFIPLADVAAALESDPDSYTPWFKLEWEALTGQYRDEFFAALGSED